MHFQKFIASTPRIESMHTGMGILAGLLVAAACLAGCLTMDVHVKVNPDASVGSYTVTMNMTSAAYTVLTESAHAAGYQNLREQLTAEAAGGGSALTYSEQWGRESVTVVLEADGPIRSVNGTQWKIQRSDGTMVYEDARLLSGRIHDAAAGEDRYSTAMISALKVHYYLEMPGRIVESNANTIADNRAEWHLSGLDAFSTTIYARSEVPLLAIPGFAASGALLGILAAAMVVLRRKA